MTSSPPAPNPDKDGAVIHTLETGTLFIDSIEFDGNPSSPVAKLPSGSHQYTISLGTPRREPFCECERKNHVVNRECTVESEYFLCEGTVNSLPFQSVGLVAQQPPRSHVPQIQVREFQKRLKGVTDKLITADSCVSTGTITDTRSFPISSEKLQTTNTALGCSTWK